MTPYDVGLPKQMYEERVREAAEDHLAAHVARVNPLREHHGLLREVVSWLRSLPANAEGAVLRGRHV